MKKIVTSFAVLCSATMAMPASADVYKTLFGAHGRHPFQDEATKLVNAGCTNVGDINMENNRMYFDNYSAGAAPRMFAQSFICKSSGSNGNTGKAYKIAFSSHGQEDFQTRVDAISVLGCSPLGGIKMDNNWMFFEVYPNASPRLFAQAFKCPADKSEAVDAILDINGSVLGLDFKVVLGSLGLDQSVIDSLLGLADTLNLNLRDVLLALLGDPTALSPDDLDNLLGGLTGGTLNSLIKSLLDLDLDNLLGALLSNPDILSKINLADLVNSLSDDQLASLLQSALDLDLHGLLGELLKVLDGLTGDTLGSLLGTLLSGLTGDQANSLINLAIDLHLDNLLEALLGDSSLLSLLNLDTLLGGLSEAEQTYLINLGLDLGLEALLGEPLVISLANLLGISIK